MTSINVLLYLHPFLNKTTNYDNNKKKHIKERKKYKKNINILKKFRNLAFTSQHDKIKNCH